MVLADITSTELQNLIVLEYEAQVKVILLVGWWIFSLIYLLYWYERQQPTKFFLVGTFRAIMYMLSFMWAWLFWLLFPVYYHPAIGISDLLIFLAYAYTILIMIFFVMLVFNFTLWIPKFIINKGKLDMKGFEDDAIKEYFGKAWEKK